jgi:uncharacterized protein
MNRFAHISKFILGIASLSAMFLLLHPFCARALKVPPLTHRVNDFASMISIQTRDRLEAHLSEFEKSESTQVVVLTIDSLEGDSLEDFSMRVFEAWRIGQAGRDNGVLLLISKSDRKIRIEVGYGLEGKLTDLNAGRIIRDVIAPEFKKGSFDVGIQNGVDAILKTVLGEFEPITSTPDDRPGSALNQWMPLLFPLIFGFTIVGNVGARNRIIGAIAGGLIFPGIAAAFLGKNLWLMLAMVPVGVLLGYIASLFFLAFNSHGRTSYRRSGRYSRRGSGPIIINGGDRNVPGGGFGGFDGGGFSGGGGSGGGGGASGGW